MVNGVKRPLFLAAMAMTAGVLLSLGIHRMGIEPGTEDIRVIGVSAGVMAVLMVGAGIAYQIIRKKRNSKVKIFNRLPCWGVPVLFLILCLSLWNTWCHWPKEFPKTMEGQALSVKGAVWKLQQGEYTARIYIKNTQWVVLLPGEQAKEICPGMVCEFTGEAKSFSTPGNPGQFDERRYYGAMGYVGQLQAKTWTASSPDTVLFQLRRRIYQWRGTLLKRIREGMASVPGISSQLARQDSGILQTMLLGEKSGLPEETRELYQEGGAAHLLSISGLHVSIICMGLFRLFRKLRVPAVPGAVLAGGVCAGYLYISGMAVSSLRAGIMFGVSMGAILTGRGYDLISAWSLALIILLGWKPLLLIQPGFQLSFGAVLLIGAEEAWGKHRREKKKEKKRIWGDKILAGLRTGMILCLGMAPVLAWHYGKVTLASPLVNLLLLPLAPVLLTSGLAGSIVYDFFPGAGAVCFGIAHAVLRVYSLLCRLVAALPFGTVVTGRPAFWQILGYLGLCIAPYMMKAIFPGVISRAWGHLTRRMVVGVCCLGLVAGLFLPLLLTRIPYRGLEITMLDVGQGECIFTRFPDGGAMLTDGGSSDVSGVWQYRIKPYLTNQGVDSLDLVLVTHSDGDHCSGILEMLQEGYPVGMLALPFWAGDSGGSSEQTAGQIRELVRAARANGTRVIYLSEGHGWKQGRGRKTVKIQVLWPWDSGNGSGNLLYWENSNEGSLVYRLEYGDFSMLFTGDLTRDAEQALCSRFPVMTATVLKCAHHGSGYSSTAAFLESVQPAVTLISCGRDNPYGHPDPRTLARLESVGSSVFQTSQRGAVTIRIKKSQMDVFCFGSRKNGL